MKKFEPIPCNEHQLKSIITHKAFWWVLATSITIIIALNGIIYSSVSSRIDGKADRELVMQMQTELHDLWLMHVKEGYKSSLKGE